ncbi:HAD family hydrolase [Jatrophihabitans sp.]|uniref:HAD family hydrolase n=1 Tax=Jatrophihabitans sp. TaxID=1932789 RepID=UPI0030C7369F|nr:HAD-superfamily hydrolase, subfamily variant 3 [Jatrophihabitans sp.]
MPPERRGPGIVIKAIGFDVNGTLVDIRTEDDMEQAFRAVGHFLTYQGVDLRRHDVRDLYFQTMKQQQRASAEKHPEFDAQRIWAAIIDEHASDFTRALPPDKRAQLPLVVAELYRGVTRRKLKLYPQVRKTLSALREHFPLVVVTDGQSSYARGELHKVGLTEYFQSVVVSGDHGFRKPDGRLFRYALDAVGVAPEEAMYVGNDMHRDIYGARKLGMATVMYDSDQGTKSFRDCQPDHHITDYRQLLEILGLPPAS